MGNLSERVYLMELKEKKKNQEQQERIKEIENIERKKEIEKNKKEYEKGLNIALESELIQMFNNCIEREGLEKGKINLNLKITYEEILQKIPQNEVERYFLQQNYYKILNKTLKIYENDKKAKEEYQKIIEREEFEKELPELEKQEKINKGFSIFFNIIKWTLIILFFGVYIIFYFINGLAKSKTK